MRRREVVHPIEIEGHRDRFSRTVTVFIVVTMFVTAIVGFLQSRASIHFDKWGIKAQRLGVTSMQEFRRDQGSAQVDLENFALSQEYLIRAANARQRSLIDGVPWLRFSRQEMEPANLEQLAGATEQLSGIKANSLSGPDQDPIFPQRFFMQGIEAREKTLARQDAANEMHRAWKGVWNVYAGILAMLAVALYLFGVSLTLHTVAKYLLAGVAVMLLGIGGVRGGLKAIDSPHEPPDEAAEAYGKGVAKLFLATDEAGYDSARSYFDRAIHLRPSFSLAYQQRAEARFEAGSPQVIRQVVRLSSVTRMQELDTMIADLRKSLDLGLRNASVLTDLGFETLLRAIHDHPDSRPLLQESIRWTREALVQNPYDPVLHYNLGLAQLAIGEVLEAEKAYREAVLHTIYKNVEKKETNRRTQQEGLVGAALTDLELLLQAHPDDEKFSEQAQRLKEYLVRAVAFGDPNATAGPEKRVSDLRVTIFPAELQWEAYIDNFDESQDIISVQWYYQDPERRGRAVLPNVSSLTEDPPRDRSGRYYSLQNYLAGASPPQCLSPGRYRVELYLNGRLSAISEEEAPAGLETLQAAVSPSLNVAMCRPKNWERYQFFQLGIVDGYLSPDRSRGILIFRYHHPRGLDSNGALTDRYLKRSLMAAYRLFRSRPEFDQSQPDPYLMGLRAVKENWFRYPDGLIHAAAGVHRDGAILVAILFGPRNYFDLSEPDDVFKSLSTYFSY